MTLLIFIKAKKFEHKIVNIFLPIVFNNCFVCSKEPSQLDGSFEYPLDKFVCLFVFVALRPMSTAMVIAGRSVHLTTLFPGQA